MGGQSNTIHIIDSLLEKPLVPFRLALIPLVALRLVVVAQLGAVALASNILANIITIAVASRRGQGLRVRVELCVDRPS